MKLKDGKKKRWRDDTPPEKEEKKEDVITIDDCKKEVYEPDNYREWGALGNKKEVIWYDKETSEKIVETEQMIAQSQITPITK